MPILVYSMLSHVRSRFHAVFNVWVSMILFLITFGVILFDIVPFEEMWFVLLVCAFYVVLGTYSIKWVDKNSSWD